MPTKELTTSLNIAATPEFLSRRIFVIRGKKVMQDFDLAELYQVETKRLNEQVKRNLERFPDDFMFRLDPKEIESLNRSQFATGSQKHRSNKLVPYAFTELGVAMLSSVLNSDRAVQMNIFIMRAFVQLREMLVTNKDMAEKIGNIEKEQRKQGRDIGDLIVVVNSLVKEKTKLKSAIGFQIV